MVTLTKNKIILEIEDDSPEELLFEFKHSLIHVLQHLDFKAPNIKDLESSHYFVLRILQELIEEENLQRVG